MRGPLLARWRARAHALERDALALYLAYRDPRTPWVARLWAALVALYALSPIDLIPDFIPLLGYLDDLLLVPLGVALAVRLVPPAVMDDCRHRAEAIFAVDRPRAWGGAMLVMVIWLAVAIWALTVLLRFIRGRMMVG